MSMIPILVIKLTILLVLLLFTVFFTAAETSLTMLRKSQVKSLIKTKGIVKLTAWLDDPNRLLTTTLIGTAVSVIGVSVLMTTIALDLSSHYNWNAAAAASISTFITVIMVLIFAEITPKAYARKNSMGVSSVVIGPLKVIETVISPVVKIFTVISNNVIRIFGEESIKKNPLYIHEELKGLIDMGEKEGVIFKAEKKMISQLLEFSDTVVREVMVPRVDMKVLDIADDRKKLIRKAFDIGHSRFPVYEDNIDNLLGILYVKDLLPELAGNKDFDIKKLLRKLFFVPETKLISELLKEFRVGNGHIAVVVDEYGVSVGIVTIEDIVEEITGEIFDEYDKEKTTISRVSKNRWIIKAVEDLDKINDHLGVSLPEDTYDSLGGLIVGELGHLPVPGEKVKYGNCSFKVLKATPKRVLDVEIKVGKD
ncbi:MAG: hemolysin family protein [Elusimicrobia bacterium]|jgi:putative hemolysin|nr:hemolysin family protein [Elusimicrobiota bacterium]